MRWFSVLLTLACSADPKLYNTDPEATITSHDESTLIYSGYSTVFRGQVSDPNHPTSSLEIRWSINDRVICDWQPPMETGETTCSHLLEPGDSQLRLRVRDPFEAEASYEIELNLQDNQAPIVNILAPTLQADLRSDQSIVFVGQALDEFEKAEELFITWNSSLDGDLNLSLSHESDNQFEAAGQLSPGIHELTLFATDSVGETGHSQIIVEVKTENNAPNCGISLPETMSALASGSNISIVAWGSDSDQAATLTHQLRSNIDGELSSGPLDIGNGLQWIGPLSDGIHTLFFEVMDENQSSCTATATVILTEPPDVEILLPATGSTLLADDLQTLSGTVFDADQPLGGVQFEWRSDIDGLLYTSNTNSLGHAEAIVQLSPGPHDIHLRAYDIWGVQRSDAISLYVNQAPLNPIVEITPSTPQTMDTITAQTSGLIDPDGDPISLTYEWIRNGLTTPNTTPTLSFTETSKGDIWELRATAHDGHANSPPGSISFSIVNTAPSIGSIQLSPNSGVTNSDAIQCTAVATDPDETPSLRYEWHIDDGTSTVIIGLGPSLTLNSSLVAPGKELRCEAIATDADGAEDRAETAITISNRPPNLIGPSIAPSGPYNDSELHCNLAMSDPDGDPLVQTIVWTNVTSGILLGLDSSVVLNPNHASPGDIIQCEATIEDPLGLSATAYATASIENRNPVLTAVEILPNIGAKNNDQIECTAQATDPDQQSLSIHKEWRNLSTGNVIGSGQLLTLSPSLAVGGNLIGCVVTASDSDGGSDSLTAVTTIDNSPPVFDSAVQITPATNVTVGTILECDAVLSDSDGDVVSVEISWKNEDSGEHLGLSSSLHVTANGAMPDEEITCNVTASDNNGGSTHGSTSITLANSLPTVSQLTIQPLSPTTLDPITVDFELFDANNDAITHTINWTVDGTPTSQSDTLAAGQTKGSLIDVWVTPHDGREAGLPQNIGSFPIANTPPTPPIGEISPSDPRAEQQDLICEPTGPGQDIDNDPLSHQIDWLKNGGQYLGPTNTTQFAGDTIPATETVEGDIWQCIVISSDGDSSVASSPSQETIISENCYLTDCDYPAQGLDFVSIDPAVFMMGSTANETGRSFDETAHLVEITQPYGIMATEVTQEQFISTMGYNPSSHTLCPDCPVETVSWDEAAAFTNQISISEGLPQCYSCNGLPPSVSCMPMPDPVACLGYRLPTEAEWENAIRAETQNSFWTYNGGSNILNGEAYNCAASVVLMDGSELGNYSWYCQNNAPLSTPGYRPKAVGQKWANDFGVYDGHGNVWEWTHDYYESDLGTGVATDPSGSLAGYGHTCRGGGYDDPPRSLRSAERKECLGPAEWLGFRIAITEH